MAQGLAVAAGGAVGSLLRFWLSMVVHAQAGRAFPYGTLAVNVGGCLAMGFLSALFLDRFTDDPLLRSGVLIGLLGGFTTFSAFSFETLTLVAQGAPLKAALNIAVSVALCITATWIGVVVGRQW
jgi:fluoride exporter